MTHESAPRTLTPAPGAEPVLPRGLVILLAAAGAVVIIGGIRAIAGIIGPVFLALMLVIAVAPAISWLESRGMRRWGATAVALLLLYGGVLAFGGLIALSVAQLATELPGYADEAQELIDSLNQRLRDLGVGTDVASAVGEQVDLGNVLDILAGLIAELADGVSNVVFLLALLLFMTMDAAGYPQRLAAAARVRPEVATALSSFAAGTRRYLVVSTVFGLIVAAFDTVALALIGVPLPLLWGLLSFITNYVPNIGFVLGLIPPALLGLLDGGPKKMLVVIALYSVINFVIQSIIQPKFVGESVGLSVTMTFLALTFWAWAIGPLGALLAIPLTLLTKALLIDVDPATRWVNLLISSTPPEHPRALADEDGDAGKRTAQQVGAAPDPRGQPP
jgi:predicted PurR-regulated permease PerM